MMFDRDRKHGLPGLLLIVLGLSASSGWAETELPGGRPIEDLELTEDYVCELDGEELGHAKIYFSEREVAYLLTAPELGSPLLISPRGDSVQAVSLAKLTKSGDLDAVLGGDAATEYLGKYEKSHGVMSFTLDGRTVRLLPRPPMLGSYTFGAVEDRHPRYAKNARAALPGIESWDLKAMASSEVRIRLYFASWSPICKRLVPKMMQLERELQGKLVVEYYGLPKPLSADPIVKEKGIYGVPTAVVYLDGEEIGRLTGRQLDKPGEALQRLLEGHP